jgi:NTP pyrophosphatase (non-canonical NTP hydrolase)
MIYTIFLYQASTGALMYEQNFQELDSGNAELFSSFYTALKSFVSEMVNEGVNKLKNIDLGEYSIVISSIKDFDLDIVIIADKENLKAVNKLIPKLIKSLNKHESLIQFWDGDKSELYLLEQPLSELIKSHFKSTGKTLTEKQDQVLRSIWANRSQLSEEKENTLIQERDLLIYKIEKTPILPNKIKMAREVVELSDKLKDEGTFLRFQDEINRYKKELEDARFKLGYYLEKLKISLNEAIENLGDKPISAGDYKDAYLSLYSFSTKLKLLIESGWENYREMATKLIDNDNISKDEITDTIQSIIKMSDKVEDYLQ